MTAALFVETSAEVRVTTEWSSRGGGRADAAIPLRTKTLLESEF